MGSSEMAEAARARATAADLQTLPDNVVGEIVHGVLETHPRPAPRHAAGAGELNFELLGPFRRGIGGPGGWIILPEPQLHLGLDVLVPDLAAWRRERLPHLGDAPYISIAPDWVCEVLSPSTARLDRGAKRDIYAREGVAHLWLLDPAERILECFSLTAGHWLLAATFSGDDEVRAAPFDAISFSLSNLFPYDPPEPAAEQQPGN
jgi:Uma2 family endonuclease